MIDTRWFPAGLARRFALGAAGLVAAALLATSLVSWWLINQQHDQALDELVGHERQFRAAAVGSDLTALAGRMSEIAGSTILATGLVDSAGRETYLGPFLAGIRQINGIPVQVMFTDFEGTEIASNSGAAFSAEQVTWLRQTLDAGRPLARIFTSPRGAELVAVEPMVYARTRSPEGAVLYKIELKDIKLAPNMTLRWGKPVPEERSAQVPVPDVFKPLQFRVYGERWAGAGSSTLELPYLHVLLISLTLFSAVVVAGVQLARVLTSDLRRLQAFSSRLFGSGLSTERAPEEGSDEVVSLARSINGMLDRLNEQHLTLLREREKLTELTQALQAADRNKDNFLAMLGHELRNPLAPISAGAELLRRVRDNDERVVRTSEMIARQVRHMTKIVNDLLDVSRVTRGLITLEKVEVEVSELVSAGIEQVRPLIESRRHTLTVSMPRDAGRVTADRARLVQVVSNLLTNAARYTQEGGHIEVEVRPAAREIAILICDNGQGISPDLMPEIFELFTQGTRTMDRNEGGLGLGLALVKHLVALHDGVVEARSPGQGQGATFEVRLPRAQPSRAPVSVVPHDPPALADPRQRRVLVVDDNVDAARSLAQLLTLEGHVALVVHDGHSALALARAERQPFDAFILDIGLPGMDGVALARHLRALPSTARSIFVALTGYGQLAELEASGEQLFDRHLVKPADFAVLQSMLGQARASEPVGVDQG